MKLYYPMCIYMVFDSELASHDSVKAYSDISKMRTYINQLFNISSSSR